MPNPGTELASLDFGNLIGGPLNAVITAQSIAARSTADFIKTVGFDKDNQPVYVDFKYPKEIQPYQPKQNPMLASAPVTTAGAGYTPGQVVNVTFAVNSPANELMKATGTVVANNSGDIPIGTQINITNPGEYKTGATLTATIEAPASTATTAHTALITTVTLSAEVAAQSAVYQDMKFSVPLLTMLPVPFIKVDLITVDFNAKINSMETQSSNSETSVSGSLEVHQGWFTGGAKLSVSAAYKKSTASSASIERTYSMGIHVQASQDEMPAGMEKLLNLLESAMISTPGDIKTRD